ncbi:phosphoribosylanthranilate isomerase [Staphylococcus hyicus]|uniref:phosphoribosylanthranilate isomerase n=1 Tax=Staphylococcus hyicus TaxID=1284 RepID=UPI000D1ECEB6|nr:phosphoribosylanthranilate isomerase [Staphylococcus hyicus]PTJ88528.1 phosphoribosylanthranilate isomerase [Staphylococcus hyicus]
MYLKLCGFTRCEDVKDACQLNIDALGFITFPKSKRYVDLESLAQLSERIPSQIDRVAVTVNMPYEQIKHMILTTQVNTIQLHGDEPLSLIHTLKAKHPHIKLFKALPANEQLTLQIARFAPHVDKILVDTPSPMYGGTGQMFDWHILQNVTTTPLIVAGGLNISNLPRLFATHASIDGVDVASAIEKEKGIKDKQKMTQIVDIVKGVR